MANLNIGDVVRLKSGGPLMTIRELTAARSSPADAPKDHAHCQWFEGEKISNIVPFPFAALELGANAQG